MDYAYGVNNKGIMPMIKGMNVKVISNDGVWATFRHPNCGRWTYRIPSRKLKFY